jgi:hypothetical protein
LKEKREFKRNSPFSDLNTRLITRPFFQQKKAASIVGRWCYGDRRLRPLAYRTIQSSADRVLPSYFVRPAGHPLRDYWIRAHPCYSSQQCLSSRKTTVQQLNLRGLVELHVGRRVSPVRLLITWICTPRHRRYRGLCVDKILMTPTRKPGFHNPPRLTVSGSNGAYRQSRFRFDRRPRRGTVRHQAADNPMRSRNQKSAYKASTTF